MTAHRGTNFPTEVVLICQDCPERISMAATLVDKAREDAKRAAGWSSDGRADYCPEHTAARS
ncbi:MULTISPECIES: hypothetical protein [unclassified Microbacterium]|uniref:hypothetical protein n=1 Tax=unclassified Microbacterium TaxID=2609290 RepID=UPI00364AC900